MSSPPSFITVELEEQDVQADLLNIVESMRAIRREEINENQISEAKKDAYLHLSYRLASALEGLADDYMISRMQGVVDALEGNQLLFNYDYLQDNFWNAAEPEFSKNLDELVIASLGDDFGGLEDKHHFLNALKYLASKEEPTKKRLQMYDDLLAFQTSNLGDESELLEKRLFQYGQLYDTDNLTITLHSVTDIDNVLATASHMGYHKVRIRMPLTTFNKDSIEEVYPQSKIIDTWEVRRRVRDDENEEKPKGKLANAIRIGVALTFPFSAPLISGLSTPLVTKINDYFERNNVTPFTKNFEDYACWGAGLELGQGAAAAAGSVVLMDHTTGYESLEYGLMAYAAFMGASFISRICTAVARKHWRLEPLKYDKPRGGYALAYLPVTLPLSLYGMIKKKEPVEENKDKEEESLDNLRVSVEFPLEKIKEGGVDSYRDTQNFHSHLEGMCNYKLSAAVKKNLVWGLENHHQQGKKAIASLQRRKEAYQEKFKIQYHLSREAGALTVYDVFHSGAYKKVSSFICFPDQKYALTVIGKGDEIMEFEQTADWLHTNTLGGNKVKELGVLLNAQYIHLSRFENEQKTHDFTITR